MPAPEAGFVDTEFDAIDPEDRLCFASLQETQPGRQVEVRNVTRDRTFPAQHALSVRQIEVLRAGGLINWTRARTATPRVVPDRNSIPRDARFANP